MIVTIPILSPVLALVILMEPRSHPLHQLAAVGLVAVNLMWFVKFSTKYWGAATAAAQQQPPAKAVPSAAGGSPRKPSTVAA